MLQRFLSCVNSSGKTGVAIALLVTLLACSTVVAQPPDVAGQWASLPAWPCNNGNWVPTHAMLLPNGKVFYLSSYNDGTLPRLWDPITQSVTSAAVPGYNLFCAGHSALASGELFVSGGHIDNYVGVAHAAIYDAFTDQWTRVPDMNAGRWYPTNTTLANGDVLVVSGTTSGPGAFNTLPQVFQPATGTWRDLTSAVLQQPLYPYMYLAPNGNVFAAGPNRTTRYLDTAGTGVWTFVANNNSGWRNYGSSVMYEPGKILIVGGGGESAGTQPTASAEVIDLNSTTPVWRFVAPMYFARRQHNATILPDGTVLVTGGTGSSGFDEPALAVHAAEIWNPSTDTWTLMSSNTLYRGYHSFALLLPDGRVLSAGGQRAGCTAEIFSPPYLFKGARPEISAAPAAVAYGQTTFIGTPDAVNVSDVTWVRLGAVTHGYDQEQRLVRLAFSQATGGLNVSFPTSANLSPPGYYMLFLLNGNAVPSVSKIIRISAPAPPGTGAIAGKVTNISTGAVLAGATVSNSGGSTTTDTGGNYKLNNVTPGTTSVTASRTGFGSRTLQATVTSGATATLNFALATSGKIAGTVKNSSGAAIAGAAVKVSGGVIATTKTLTTTSTGSYSSSWIPVGSYTVSVSATGLTSQSKPATVSTGQTITVDFTMQ